MGVLSTLLVFWGDTYQLLPLYLIESFQDSCKRPLMTAVNCGGQSSRGVAR